MGWRRGRGRKGEEERGVGEVERMGRQGGKTHDRRKNKELQICQSCNGILYPVLSFSLGRKDKVADAQRDTHTHARTQTAPPMNPQTTLSLASARLETAASAAVRAALCVLPP